jgi:hypothetical protein
MTNMNASPSHALSTNDFCALPPATQHVAPPDSRQRRYLDGDQCEWDPSCYKCTRCDAFLPADHFSEHGPHRGDSYLEDLQEWKKRGWRTKLEFRRPDDARNLFETGALEARAQYKALRPAFSRWLLVQRARARAGARRDSVGWMALELLTSSGLPRTPASVPLLREHYERHGAQYFTLEAIETAWEEFLSVCAGNSAR